MDSAPTPPTREQLLRQLLRKYRRGISREDVGLKRRPGQHEGLSLEDLSKLTNYRTQLLSRLENGKPIRTGLAKLLDTVATALRMPPDERRALWLLAAGTPPPMHAYNSDDNPSFNLLIQALNPNPAIVTDLAFNVLASNTGVATWFVDFAAMPQEERNYAKWVLSNPHARHVLVGWKAYLDHRILSGIRAAASQAPDDPAILALIDEVRRSDHYIDALWSADAGNYFDPPTELLQLRLPGHTDPHQPDDEDHRVTVHIVNIGPTRPNDGRRIIAFLLPHDEQHPQNLRSEETCLACRP